MKMKEFVQLIRREAGKMYGQLPSGVSVYIDADGIRRDQVQMVMQSDDRSAEDFCRKGWPLARIRAHLGSLQDDFGRLKAGQHTELTGHRA